MARIARFAASLATAAAVITIPAVHADTGVLNMLAQLPVQSPESMDGYSRSEFGTAWSDNNDDDLGHNGCDTRDDILNRDLTNVVHETACTVLSGILHDPYTSKTIEFQRGRNTSSRVQIDHLVPLGDAWRTGAQHLSPRQRENLANDPRNLLAVDGPANESKGDQDASSWLPPNGAFHCTYVTDQIKVKSIYHLWITPAEHEAMAETLSHCP